MQPLACLIFNPVAGQGDSDRDLKTIREFLAPHFKLTVCHTSTDRTAEQLARDGVANGANVVIAAGGDGTISAIARVLRGTDIPLGIISRGTVNAFASALGLPSSVAAACRVILAGRTRTVDMIVCNGQAGVLLTAVGFEAETIDQTSRAAKDRFGVLAYVLTALRELRTLEHFTAEIETGDRRITVTAAAIAIANVAPPQLVLAQGPSEIAPDDGQLDLTIVAPQGFASAIAASFELFRSGINDIASQRSDVGFLRAEHFCLTAHPPQKVALDGEMVGMTPVEIHCIPQALTLLAPQTPAQRQPQERLEQLPDLLVQPLPSPEPQPQPSDRP